MHWLAALPYAIPVAIILAIAWVNRERRPVGWLAWATDAVARLFAIFATILLCMAGWVAWRGDFVAVGEIDWINAVLIAALTAVVVVPLILLLDLPDQLKRRRKARGET